MKTVKILSLSAMLIISGCASMTNEELNALSRQLAQQNSTYNYQTPYVAPVTPVRPNFNYQHMDGTPVYNASQCVGTIVFGQCVGTITPSSGLQKKCYGMVINGECNGALGY
ncbi:MAG: hypothetical protein Q7T62_02070 [Undibacterium sp.]|nr:hypothetical protein [Undibacterium sp.]